MVTCTYEEWKKSIEGIRRGDVGPFVQQNVPSRNDSIRRYLDGESVVMEMFVIDANTDKLGQDCERVFYATQEILTATSYIYIPTDEEIEEWNENDLDIEGQIKLRE